MADQQYYSLFTKQGLALLTDAIQHGTKLGITSMAFGDGGGSLPVPNESMTKLVNEVYRTQLNSLAPDPNNANWLRAEAIIASSIGGFNIRELGLYAGDTLVAYSNYPSTYKPNPSDGTARIMTFRMVLQIDNTAIFELKIDPDIVLATIQSVSEAKKEIYENTATVVPELSGLANLIAWQNRHVYVRGDGHYYSDGNTWVKDQTLNIYDFKTQQYVAYYYEQLKNWDDAIYLAQKNIVAKGYSPKLILPTGIIDLYRPILGLASLGDQLHADFPELGIKDTNGVFQKSFPMQLFGSCMPPYTYQGDVTNGTGLRFRGCKSQTDLTYMNFGIIHCAPTNPLEFANASNTTMDTWGYANVIVEDLTATTLNQDGTEFGTIHGLFMFRHHWHQVRNIAFDAIYGAGILTNWIFDSNIENYAITRCGRMSPNINDYQKDGNFSIEYQTYAPLHVICTAPEDSTNFMKSSRGHFEHNYRAVADIIVSGGTPVWLADHHHESGDGLIANAKAVLATNAGVMYPCQDSEIGFDYKNFKKPAKSTVVICNNITGYSKNYGYAMIIGQYTDVKCSIWRFNSNIKLNAGNTNCILQASQSLFYDLDLSATFADKFLDLTDVKISGNFNMNYCGAISLQNVSITGNFTVNNMYKTSQSSLRNVSANLFSGDIGNAVGDISQTSTAESSNIQASQGVIEYTNIDTILARI